MAKQMKSVRLDEDLVSLFDEYSACLTSMFGEPLSFSGVLSDALKIYLEQCTSNWVDCMRSGSIIERKRNGKIKEYKFTVEQISRMEKLHQEAFAFLHGE